MTKAQDPTKRFSNLVGDYVKFRPSYPKAVLEFLKSELKFDAQSIVADIGSGTGIFTKLLLENGCTVYAVEPNEAMREAAEKELGTRPKYRNHFFSIGARAESTTLKTHSVDFITCAQAFHWFDAEKTREEFTRILKPGGTAVLIWNTWDMGASPFMKDYKDTIYRFCKTFHEVSHEGEEAKQKISTLFIKNGFKTFETDNEQLLNLEGLKGRVLSSSYAPQQGNEHHEPLIQALEVIFQKYQTAGVISFPYKTRLYYGAL